MSDPLAQDNEVRDAMLRSIRERRGCGPNEAAVILDRIAARLDGHSHDEVKQLHPLPGEDDPS